MPIKKTLELLPIDIKAYQQSQNTLHDFDFMDKSYLNNNDNNRNKDQENHRSLQQMTISNPYRKKKSKGKINQFGRLITAFSKKAYITKTNVLHPIINSDSEEEQQTQQNKFEHSKQMSQFVPLNEDDIKNSIQYSERDYKYYLLQNISPKEFYEIKKSFESFSDEEGIDIFQFVGIFCQCMFGIEKFEEQYGKQVDSLTEIFMLIDRQHRKKINWQQFSDFLLDMQEILKRDESLFETKLNQIIFEENIPIQIEKLFHYDGFSKFGVLDPNQKSIKLINPANFEQVEEIKAGGHTITTSIYIKEHEIILIGTNDKFFHIYDPFQHSVVRKFIVPEVQQFMDYSEQTSLLYTATHKKNIYAWDINYIMSKPFLKEIQQMDIYKKAIKYKITVDTVKDITCILNIDILGLILVGSGDCLIRIFDTHDQTDQKKPIDILKGHSQGIRALAYNDTLGYIVSCAFDFDILVWNTHLSYPVAKLKGNDAPMNNIICPKSEKYLLLSFDINGILKLWDLNNFQCLQSLQVNANPNIKAKSITFLDNYNKIILGSKTFQAYEFDKSYNPSLTDDKVISAVCFSKLNMELYSSSGNSIKCWDMKIGRIVRVFKELCQGDITQITLVQNYDQNQEEESFMQFMSDIKQRQIVQERTAFLGSSIGEIVLMDILTGFVLKKLENFQKEVLFLRYSPKYNLLISGSQDKSIKIFNNNPKIENRVGGLLRKIENTYQTDLTMGAYSDNLQLIATMGRDAEIRIWDVEKGTYKSKIESNIQYQSMYHMKFLDPFPLLATADIAGYIYVWSTQPLEFQNQLLLRWKNMFTISKISQVTSLNYDYDEINNKLHLVLGDETGYVRILDISEVLKQFLIQPERKMEQQNMFRQNNYNYSTFENNDYNNYTGDQSNQVVPLPEKSAKQVLQWQAHTQENIDIPIICIKVIKITKQKNYLTVGQDKKIKLFDSKGNLIGVLKQSETSLQKKNYLDSTNNNEEAKSKDWNIEFKSSTSTIFQKQQQLVRKQLDKAIQKINNKLKSNKIPFYNDMMDEEYAMRSLSRVSSEAIYKSLKEVDDIEEHESGPGIHSAQQNMQQMNFISYIKQPIPRQYSPRKLTQQPQQKTSDDQDCFELEEEYQNEIKLNCNYKNNKNKQSKYNKITNYTSVCVNQDINNSLKNHKNQIKENDQYLENYQEQFQKNHIQNLKESQVVGVGFNSIDQQQISRNKKQSITVIGFSSNNKLNQKKDNLDFKDKNMLQQKKKMMYQQYSKKIDELAPEKQKNLI
ncbi:WD40-repeat-containing domain [Pseudocohnilembus persalinus]|uniref:WD40-repeat-containing domain n=1 Tax=Pseudocohnilembus persalinus TaxID=266149 RepID=A0A0V0R2B1_PSEPJ|nr:WD40-repeat-containing domain [Pseudocohnilembus persalinus]|eukprot:KRX08309.1 WD40-repeat-containing domain [Pseudocohnilembus persalinus]